MNIRAAVEEVIQTIRRTSIVEFLRYMASQSGKEILADTPASEFVEVCIEAVSLKGEIPQNEIQWHAYAMRLLEKHGYPQEAKDELMALITGMRWGVS